MRQRSTIIWLAVVVAASAALILLLNIAPEAPEGVAQPPAVRISEVPTINAIPIVKLSELNYLLQTAMRPRWLYIQLPNGRPPQARFLRNRLRKPRRQTCRWPASTRRTT